ncbi:hypothetical protein E4T43_05249 [Aureobasidium subglaciale]|nr:hypothetical protein E4T43_05249 [Aureobasidium subglaciale]
MGAVQSDLKSTIVQASSPDVAIPSTLTDFWQTFWQRPETAEHVFETITPSDLRTMRDHPKSFKNFETLILTVSTHLIQLRRDEDSLFAKDAVAFIREALNCVRTLTRVLPFVYECDRLCAWEQSFFWEPTDDTRPPGVSRNISGESATAETLHQSGDNSRPDTSACLGEELIDSLLDLAFWSGFTLPINMNGRNGPTYGFWQSGIAYERRLETSKEFESRRTEIMQLLLVLESKCIYKPANAFTTFGSEAVESISNHRDRKKVQYLLCSLLNTVLKYQPDARYLSPSPREVHETHVRTCLHFLQVNLLNRSPWVEGSAPPDNRFRDLFSHLHKATHLQFLADGILKILRQPLEASSNGLNIVQRPLLWAHEIIPLLWESLYSNKYFRAFICETGRQFELTVFLLFYILDPNKNVEGVQRVSLLCVQTMSENPEYAISLNKQFDGHDNLPSFMQIKNFHGSYADYLFTWLLTLLKPKKNGQLDAMAAALVGIIVNVSPYIFNLGRATSLKLIQLVDLYTRNSLSTSVEVNAMVLTHMVRAVNSMLEEHKPGAGSSSPGDCHRSADLCLAENENLLWAIWKYGTTFEHLADLRMEVDSNFKQILEQIRENGIAEPTLCPDGTVLHPLVAASDIANMDKDKAPRPRLGRGRTWLELRDIYNPAASPTMLPVDDAAPPSGDGSAEKQPSVSTRAMGKQPEKSKESADFEEERARALTSPSTDMDIVRAWLPQMPLLTILSLFLALQAWTAKLLEERGMETSQEAVDGLGMDEVLQPVRNVGRICVETTTRNIHTFPMTAHFSEAYAAFYWGLVVSQDLQHASTSGSGIWSSTNVRLFKIRAGEVVPPSLLSPKGAVDALGESLNLALKFRQQLNGSSEA